MAKKSKAACLVAELDGWEDREEEPVEDSEEDGSSSAKAKGHVERKPLTAIVLTDI